MSVLFDVQGSEFKPSNYLLYAITEENFPAITERMEETCFLKKIEAALVGGITALQLRIKQRSAETEEELLRTAFAVQALCKRYSVPLIINDYVDLASRLDADGVHLGPNDMPLKEARCLLGENKIIGVSMKTVEGAVQAEQDGADYLGVGAVFATQTKRDTSAMPIEKLSAICRSVNIPVVAIGGITVENATRLRGTGISGIAVVSAIFSAVDTKKATSELLRLAQSGFA